MTRSHLLAGAILLGAAAVGAPAFAAVPAVNAVAGDSFKPLVQVAATVSAVSYMSYSPRNVQLLLSELGYSLGAPDGVIGAKSRAAIRAFQTDAGLPPSGEPSLALFGKLQEAVARQQGASSAPPAAATPAAPPSDMVAGIQGELRQRGYAVSSLNGQLDSATTAAIRSYQAAAGLPVTGQPTQALLTSLQSAPRSAAAVTQWRRDQVRALQASLNAHGYDAGPEDGAIGPKVRGAIRSFQTANAMPVTGEVSPELMARLGIGPGGTAQAPAPAPQDQDTGFVLSTAQVLGLEQSLTALGYRVGKVDGIYDEKTRAAIEEYQEDNVLPKDGLATPSLLASVDANLGARTGTTGTVGRSADLTAQQVWTLQQALGRQGYYMGSATGVYDAETQTAVRGYQRDAGLTVSGTADAALLARLQSGTVQTTASPAVVGAIENELSRKGYRVGTIDGQNDAQTQAAIVAFVRQAQLNMPAAPSQQLLNAIRASSMTAQEGARRDLINSGSGALGDVFGNQ